MKNLKGKLDEPFNLLLSSLSYISKKNRNKFNPRIATWKTEVSLGK